LVGSALGMAGVIIILAGQLHAQVEPEALIGAAAVLLSAFCYAYNIILMRRQSQVADPFEVAFFQNATVAICLGLFAGWFSEFPAAHHWPAIALAAVLASVSLFLLSWAYAHAEASYLVPTEFTAFLWASLLGYLVFGERVGPATVAGAALIICGCVIAARVQPEQQPEREVVP